MLKGRTLSILGDSISTYKGVSNDAAACGATEANPYFYSEPFPLAGTYWMRVLNALQMRLCVNNSYSGGNLSGRDDAGAGVNRASRLARDDGELPDFIIVFMGINDLGRGVPKATFAADYEATLSTISALYPDADVCCVGIPDRDVFLKSRAQELNSAIVTAAGKAGEKFFVADLFGSRLNNDFYYMNTLDGLHPDEDGMRIIADIILDAIDEKGLVAEGV